MARNDLPQVIPSNMKVVQVGSETYLQKKSRSRRKYKTPKAVRDKIAASRKKMKIPVLTTASLAVGLGDAAVHLASGIRNGNLGGGLRASSTAVIRNYTGYDADTRRWSPMQAKGAFALIIERALRKTGLTGMVNRQLGRANIPFLRL